jgi:hypothetical protein
MRPDLSVALLFLACTGCSGDVASDPPRAEPAVLSVSGQHAHGNLQVWLVHGPDGGPQRALVPLADALAGGRVALRETGEVQELAIENITADADVFLQAGDIVQGGDQDRTVASDLVLAADAGRVSLAAFCVEQGRWSPRGCSAPLVDRSEAGVGAAGQSRSTFVSAANCVPTLALKRAVAQADQARVWNEVGNVQGMLASFVAPAAVDASSPTSLELTLDTDTVRNAADGYVAALGGILEGRDDVVGCAFAVGGRMQTADLYGSRALLRSLWPKLLRAAATAALVAGPEAAVPVPSPEMVRAFLAGPADAKVRRQSGDLAEIAGENAFAQVIESRKGGVLLHRACLAK